MRSSLSLSAAFAGYLSLASAHFTLKHPESIGTKDSTSDESPCGGFTPDVSDGSDQLVDVHVGGEAFALQLSHSRATWLFRATLDPEAKSDWEKVYPITVQSGLGDFCIPQVTFPDDWAGQKGVISVVSSADDGQLYQCIAANFVDGSADAPSSCTNASVSAYFTDDATLEGLLGDASGSEDSSSETSSAAPEPTEDAGGAAAALQMWSTKGLASFVTVVSMMMFGGALMI